MCEKEEGEGKSKAPAGQAGKERLKASRELYNEVQRGFKFHDDANTVLDKKAQGLMTATALVAAVFAALAADNTADWQEWSPLLLGSASIFITGVIATFVLCIYVNFSRPQPVPIVGEKLLCHDELDDKAYTESVAGGEEEYYKSRIQEYSQVMIKQERINKLKAKLLNIAYAVFAAYVVFVIPGLVFGHV